MNQIPLCFFLLVYQFISAQDKEVVTIRVFGIPTYKIIDKKIYSDSGENSSKLYATIRGNKIYKDSSFSEQDVLFTIENEKVYKTSLVNQKEESL